MRTPAAVLTRRPASAPARPRRARPESVLVFYKQLSSAIAAGLTVSRGLQGALTEADDQALRAALADISRRVDAGEALSAAMAHHPGCFSPLACTMVRAAEHTGALAHALRVVEGIEHRALQIRRTIRAALVYPSIVVAASVAVVILLTIVVLPKFAEVFEASQVQMPAVTRAIMAISRTAARYWWALLGASLVTAAWIVRWAQTPEGRERIDRALWNAPRLGDVVRKLQVSHVSSTLAGLLQSGVPMLDALALVEQTAQNTVLRSALQTIRETTARGAPLSQAMRVQGRMPGMLVQLAAMGEETGQLPRMLDEYAQIAREDAEVAVQTMLRLLEPAMLLMVGGMVAFIAASVYVPLSQLGNVIAGGAR